MAKPEDYATDECKSRFNAWRARMFRNNSGGAFDKTGRKISFGLGNTGSKKWLDNYRTGDDVGFLPIVVTPEMVGHTIAVFVNAEYKKLDFKEKLHYNPKTREYGQNNFNILVRQNGGIAGFARKWEDVDKMITDFYNQFQEGHKDVKQTK